MKLRNLIAAASLAILPLTAGAATLVIPVAGTTPGANNSHWQSEVTLHNTSGRAIAATFVYHDQSGTTASKDVTVPARNTVTLSDIVNTAFNVSTGAGAIEIAVADADVSMLAVTSRIANVTDHGELGQDIAVVNVSDAAKVGDVTTITGPARVESFRFNFGAYALADAIVRWQLIRADGTIDATHDKVYTAGQQVQYNGGVETLFNSTAKNNDVIHATVTKGSVVFYGSMVDQVSGDPTFVPGLRTREESRITLTGVDRDGNGTVDIGDANHDNVLDAPIDSYTLGFPTFFRLVATGENSEKVTFEIVSSPADARLLDDAGNMQLVPSAALKGTTGEIKVRAITPSGQSSIITIPVRFM